MAKAPVGSTVEWDAEIINEKENELIAWRSLEGADVDNSGSVRFKKAQDGRCTEIKIEIHYTPPGGILGAAFAKLFGEEPQQQVDDDLRRFKQLMETGEIATTEGQSSGRASGASS
ncbi:MAG: SRPBCC family protein [Pyrinomonadaceae bacterium]